MIEKQETVRAVRCPKCGNYGCINKAHEIIDGDYRDDVFGAELHKEMWKCDYCGHWFEIQAEYRMVNYVVVEEGEPGDTIYDIAE